VRYCLKKRDSHAPFGRDALATDRGILMQQKRFYQSRCYGRPMEEGRPLYFRPVVSFFFLFFILLSSSFFFFLA